MINQEPAQLEIFQHFLFTWRLPGDQRLAIKEIAQELNLAIVNENSEVIQLSGFAQFHVVFANRFHAQSMLDRLRQIGSLPYPVVSPEDIIGLKIQAFTGNRSREFMDRK